MAKSFFIVFLLSTRLLASDCGGLQEGEIIRLDAPGKSLANFTVQDQDGLGTCASNASSLLLQSVIESHPPISYIQLASINKRASFNSRRQELTQSNATTFDVYAQKKSGPIGAVNPNKKSTEDWKLGIDVGDVCEVIEAAKNYQKSSPTEGICRSGLVNIEKMAGSQDGGWIQRNGILAISKYMNEFQHEFGDAAVVKTNDDSNVSGTGFSMNGGGKKYTEEQIKKNADVRKKYQDFKLALEGQLNNKEILHSNECKTVNSDTFSPVLEGLSSYFLANSYCFDGKHDSFSICKLIKKIMTVTTQADGSFRPVYQKEFLNNLSSSFSQSNIPATRASIMATLYESIQKMIDLKNNNFLKSQVNSALDDISPVNATKTASEINEIRTNGFSKSCTERKMISYLGSDEFIKDAKSDAVLCNSSDVIENVKDVIKTAALSGLSDINRVRDFLLNTANLNFDQAMMGLYAYDCSASDKVRIPENIICKSTDVKLSSKNDINQKVVNELKNNRALAASICASILDKPFSQFSKGECGSHAIGITGVQCQNGQLKYLIQNSWGKFSKAKNPAIQNDRVAAGAYWLDEQTFFDGFSSIKTLEKL